MTERPDGELVARVRAGDAGAFADLYRAHAPAVRRLAAGYVGNSDAVADVVQDTFTRALRHLPGLRDGDRFRPWLHSIARHAATDHLRSSRRAIGLGDERAEQLVSPEPGPETLAELAELAEQVRGFLACLSQRDATAVALVTHLGFGPLQVAVALGISPGAAKVVVHRARRRLRHALVMQLLVRQPSLGCAALRVLLEDDDAVGASRHLAGCPSCIGAAADEVFAFDLAGYVERRVGVAP